MKFTDYFIRRPVFAIVLSLMLLVFGIRALSDLQVRQYPELESGQLGLFLLEDVVGLPLLGNVFRP